MSNRKIMIVFEETGEDSRDAEGHPGKKFNVYLSGDKERIGKIPEDQMSAAEFWGFKCFRIVAAAISQAGAVENVEQKGGLN